MALLITTEKVYAKVKCLSVDCFKPWGRGVVLFLRIDFWAACRTPRVSDGQQSIDCRTEGEALFYQTVMRGSLQKLNANESLNGELAPSYRAELRLILHNKYSGLKLSKYYIYVNKLNIPATE